MNHAGTRVRFAQYQMHGVAVQRFSYALRTHESSCCEVTHPRLCTISSMPSVQALEAEDRKRSHSTVAMTISANKMSSVATARMVGLICSRIPAHI